MLDTMEATRLSRQGQALSDPHRLALLALLNEAGELCVSDACLVSQREQSGVSRHLRILWEAGLVDKARRDKNLFYWPTSTGERLLSVLLGSG
jgi:DNA-binding transcriptional ArsR family regulator